MKLQKSFLLMTLLATVSFAPIATTYAADIADVPQASNGQTYTEASASQAGKMEQGAFNFVRSTTDRGLGFLANENLTKAQKSNEFRKLLESSFDLNTIARFALGRYWNTATPAQQQEYSKLFHKMVVDVYTARFDEYKGQAVEVKSFRAIGNNDTLVTSYMVSPNGGDPVQLDWRVRSKNGGYKIVDVIVAGVSMSVTQRSDFASVIQQGGGNIDALLVKLRSGNSNAAK